MHSKPVAAGKSSFNHIDPDQAFPHIVDDNSTTWLDLACGAGRYTLALATRIPPNGLIYALDLWEEGLEALASAARDQGVSNIRTVKADMTGVLPLEDDSVDVCLMATVLHDLPQSGRVSALREVRRVLKDGGAAVIIEFKKFDQGPGPGKAQRIDEADAEALLSPLGFTRQASADLGEFTYLARFGLTK